MATEDPRRDSEAAADAKPRPSAPYYVSTPLYYVNSTPHIGAAYTNIIADTLARWARQHGRHTFFQTGTDEHGRKIFEAAEAAGKTPREFADAIVKTFVADWERLSFTHDNFIRTTDEDHEARVQQFFAGLLEKGDLYKGTYNGPYCTGCEKYITDDDLDDGKCKLHGTEPRQLSEENWFFRLSNYGERLLAHIDANPHFILPEGRRNEIVGKVKLGLDDISISRTSFNWGVSLPHDPAHIIWVWFDALLNYVTGLGYPRLPGEDPKSKFDTYWPCDVHLIGKDILWFHAVIWPCMLLAAGVPLPKVVYAHGWWQVAGRKMSKTLKNVVTVSQAIEPFGRDAFRFYMLRAAPVGADGDFTWDNLRERYEKDLANELGNLLNRTLALIEKNLGGEIPAASDAQAGAAALRQQAASLDASLDEPYARVDITGVLDRIWVVIRAANRFVDDSKPWELKKLGDAGREKLESVLGVLADTLLHVARALAPVIPDSAPKITQQLGLDDSWLLVEGHPNYRGAAIPAGTKVAKGSPIFPKVEDPKYPLDLNAPAAR